MTTDTLNISARFGDITHALRGPERTGCELDPGLWVGRAVMVVTDRPVTCRRGCAGVAVPAPQVLRAAREQAAVSVAPGQPFHMEPIPDTVPDDFGGMPDLSDVPAGTARGTYATHGKPSQLLYFGRGPKPWDRGVPVYLAYADRTVTVTDADNARTEMDTFGPNVKFWAGPPSETGVDLTTQDLD